VGRESTKQWWEVFSTFSTGVAFACYFSPSSGSGLLRAGSITPKSPSEKIAIPGAAGPAVKKRWLVGPFAEEPLPNSKAQSPPTVKGLSIRQAQSLFEVTCASVKGGDVSAREVADQ
jgi:hypothetical protein